jgi:hypothetical protein
MHPVNEINLNARSGRAALLTNSGRERVSAIAPCDTAERTLQGVEAMNMMRKGQSKRLNGSNAMGQAKFIESLFQVAALQKDTFKSNFV